jgi:hypothetical protein
VTWIVNWKGTDFDVDPSELDGLELSAIKQRTGMSFADLMRGIGKLDPDAIRAVFWAVEKRADADLKFSEYAGPSMRVIIPALPAYNEAIEDLGKDLPEIPAKTGSDPSPSSTDVPTGTSGND